MLSNRIASSACPLNRPRDFADTTVPDAGAPARTTVRPSTIIGSATVALKLCPGWLIFDPNGCASDTRIRVPAGMSSGAGGSSGVAAACGPEAGAGVEAEDSAEAGADWAGEPAGAVAAPCEL